MEVKSEVLEKLICNVCKGYLSVGPVLLLEDGKSVCGRCYIPDEQQSMRMLPYEQLAEDMIFPCQYHWRGCTEKRSFATLKVHEANCSCKPYSCPLHAGNCEWNGPKNQLLQHCKEIHPELVVENPVIFQYDITQASVTNFLIAAFNMLFLIHTEVCLLTQKIYHCVRLLADSGLTKDYDYCVDIANETNNIIKKGRVAPQECLTQIEEDSLAISINSLMEILGAIEGMTFKLTINSLIPEPEVKVAVEPRTEPNIPLNFNPEPIKSCVERLFCNDCNKNITYKLAYISSGHIWICSNCVDKSKKCEFKHLGCKLKDTDSKINIHSKYYCNYRNKCDICSSKFRGSLENHYQVAHFNITYPAGMLWNEQIFRNEWKDVIVTSDVGRLHCSHRLYYSQFKFDVNSSIPDGKLHFFTCKLELKNIKNGATLLKIMPLNEEYDWRIKIAEDEFMQYVNNNIFSVTLTINKTK